MVKLLDLDDDFAAISSQHTGKDDILSLEGHDRPNPNFSLRFAEALSCYPIISQLAGYVDLNTLHELSRTCRQFRANLLQYRRLLIEQTLRCENEKASPATRLGSALNASFQQWTTYANTGATIDRISSGKVGECARDLVGECRKCGCSVCRNCIIKAPQSNAISGRHRRLCRVCMKCPLDRLTVTYTAPGESATDSKELSRPPCTCQDSPWICKPCGQYLRADDTTYIRGWSWRTRYSVCGGFGAGLGEGNEGVECGREGKCLDAKKVEREVECSASELAAMEAEIEKAELDGRQWAGGYMTSEIVGIGGKVKRKIKRLVDVGAIVKEYEDERATCSGFLKREQEGVNRSWCSWCDRVIPGRKDLEGGAKSTDGDSIASGSSTDLTA